jgi:hypothetical protein
METSPRRGITPKIGGFSPANVPLPPAPLRRFHCPSRPVLAQPEDVLYAQPSDILHHLRHLLSAPSPLSSLPSLLAVGLSSAAHRSYVGPVPVRSADSTDSTISSTGTGSARAAVGDGGQQSSRSSRQRTAHIAGSGRVGESGRCLISSLFCHLCTMISGAGHTIGLSHMTGGFRTCGIINQYLNVQHRS